MMPDGDRFDGASSMDGSQPQPQYGQSYVMDAVAMQHAWGQHGQHYSPEVMLYYQQQHQQQAQARLHGMGAYQQQQQQQNQQRYYKKTDRTEGQSGDVAEMRFWGEEAAAFLYSMSRCTPYIDHFRQIVTDTIFRPITKEDLSKQMEAVEGLSRITAKLLAEQRDYSRFIGELAAENARLALEAAEQRENLNLAFDEMMRESFVTQRQMDMSHMT